MLLSCPQGVDPGWAEWTAPKAGSGTRIVPRSIGAVFEEWGWASWPYHALAVLKPSLAGVSAQSFFHCFTLASAAFNLQVATPGVSTVTFSREPLRSSLFLGRG